MRFSLLHRRLAIGASLMLLLVLSGLRATDGARDRPAHDLLAPLR